MLTTILGSPYLPDWDDAILFCEDEHEDLYCVDRMLTQLKLAGVLAKLKGFVFGGCSECGPGEGYASLTLEEILNDHVRPLGIPAWQGARSATRSRSGLCRKALRWRSTRPRARSLCWSRRSPDRRYSENERE